MSLYFKSKLCSFWYDTFSRVTVLYNCSKDEHAASSRDVSAIALPLESAPEDSGHRMCITDQSGANGCGYYRKSRLCSALSVLTMDEMTSTCDWLSSATDWVHQLWLIKIGHDRGCFGADRPGLKRFSSAHVTPTAVSVTSAGGWGREGRGGGYAGCRGACNDGETVT